MAKLSNITSILEEAIKKSEELLMAIEKEVNSMPDNPNIMRIGDNCFTINSSQLMATDNWTYEYHDFKFQYKNILAIINDVPIFKIADTVNQILAQGWMMRTVVKNTKTIIYTGEVIETMAGKYKIKLHPTVINNLKQLI